MVARLGIWIGPFSVGDMDWPLSSWGCRLAPFRLGIWTRPFLVGDMDPPLSGWGYGLVSFRLGIWTGLFPVGVPSFCIWPFRDFASALPIKRRIDFTPRGDG